MRFLLALFVLMLSFNSFAFTDNDKSKIILEEYHRFNNLVKVLEPDGLVADYLNSKKFGKKKAKVELLWKLREPGNDFEVIRIYKEHKDGSDDFAVSYYYSNNIVEGRIVVRRVIGPIIEGWRNDTVDFKTGEYLGTQGYPNPVLSKKDKKVLKAWGVTLFE